ncbi:MAG: hypothetical protein Q4D57_00885 [Clostridia bacterium]|nr:hypothetical protein [Clostridia bacterium]
MGKSRLKVELENIGDLRLGEAKKAIEYALREKGYSLERELNIKRAGDKILYIAHYEKTSTGEQGVVQVVITDGTKEITKSDFMTSNKVKVKLFSGDSHAYTVIWDKNNIEKLTLKTEKKPGDVGHYSPETFNAAFIFLVLGGSKFDSNELDRKKAIEILKKEGYDIELCVEDTRNNYRDYRRYTFEAIDKHKNEAVLVRIVAAEIEFKEVESAFKCELTYNMPGKMVYDIGLGQWRPPYKLIKDDRFNCQIWYTSIPMVEGTRVIYDPAHKIDVIELLIQMGYRSFSEIGEGNYSTVLSCKNKNGEWVAVRVVRGNRMTVEKEVEAMRKLAGMKPIDKELLEKFSKNASEKKFGPVPKDYRDRYNKGLVDRINHLSTCINMPKVIASGMGYYAFFEFPLMDRGNAETLLMPPSEEGDKINHKYIKPLIKTVLNALKITHQRGYIHADVKPANILTRLDPDGTIKYNLADFGLIREYKYNRHPEGSKFKPSEVKELHDEFELLSKKLVGTSLFMAPEVADLWFNDLFKRTLINVGDMLEKSVKKSSWPPAGCIEQVKFIIEKLKKIGPKSDIFSLGLSLFCIIDKKFLPISEITGSNRRTISDLVLRYIETNKKDLSEKDQLCLTFISKLTEALPEKRPTAAQALQDAYLK